MRLKKSSAKLVPFCLSLSVLIPCYSVFSKSPFLPCFKEQPPEFMAIRGSSKYFFSVSVDGDGLLHPVVLRKLYSVSVHETGAGRSRTIGRTDGANWIGNQVRSWQFHWHTQGELTHCVLIIAAHNLVNIGSGIGLVPNSTKPLPEPVFTYHQ